VCFMIDSLIMYVMNSVCNSTYFLPDIGGISGRKRGNALLLLLFVFIFCWCHSHLFLEAFAEILRVIEAGHIGYLGYVEPATVDQLHCTFDTDIAYEIYRGQAYY